MLTVEVLANHEDESPRNAGENALFGVISAGLPCQKNQDARWRERGR